MEEGGGRSATGDPSNSEHPIDAGHQGKLRSGLRVWVVMLVSLGMGYFSPLLFASKSNFSSSVVVFHLGSFCCSSHLLQLDSYLLFTGLRDPYLYFILNCVRL